MQAIKQPPVHANLFIARRTRSAMTLLELLIVMAIMLLVTATAIPMLLTGVEGRKLREASRLVSSYISGARSRAINTGRPFGVMIERFNAGTVSAPDYKNYAFSLSYVEVPPPYAGEYENSKATLIAGSGMGATTVQIGMLGAGPSQNDQTSWTSGPKVGDLIKFNYQGRLYRLESPDTVNYPMGSNLPDLDPPPASTPICWNLFATDGSGALPSIGIVPYQIIRQPTKAAVPPLQLPKGIVIDLSYYTDLSIPMTPRMVSYGYPFGDPGTGPYPNPMIMFYAGGAVQYVYNDLDYTRPTAPIQLFVGRRDGVGDIIQPPLQASNGTIDLTGFKTQKDQPNILSPSSQWISIGYQTGMISTTENGVQTLAKPTIDELVSDARVNAKTSQSMGGR